MSEQVPRIGRVVHFVNGDRHVPAIVTDPAFTPATPEAWEQQALTVFPVNEPPFTTVAAYDADGAPATWHWPEFVPPPRSAHAERPLPPSPFYTVQETVEHVKTVQLPDGSVEAFGHKRPVADGETVAAALLAVRAEVERIVAAVVEAEQAVADVQAERPAHRAPDPDEQPA